jgi:uncharacterized membrane protein
MKLKRVFVTGLILLLPTLITVFLLLLAFRFLNNNIAQPLGGFVLSILHLITGLSILKESSVVLKPLIGFPVALIIIMLVGYFAATILGRRLFSATEKFLFSKFPIVSFIYPYAKQFVNTFLNKEKKTEFKAVVAVQYPRLGIYCIGFLTSEGIREVKNNVQKELVAVFIPSSPTPFTGYTLMFPREETIPLKMTIDEAIRFVVSGGILTPPDLNNKQ